MRWFCGLITLLMCSSVWASGFVVARFGGEHGHPMTDNPTALYYNPGAISLGTGTRLFIDGTLAYRTVNYTRPLEAISKNGTGTPAGLEIANSGTAKLNNFAGSPFIGVASDLGIPKLGVALGLYAPFGGGASWGTNNELTEEQKAQYPGAAEGQQRWWSIDSTLKVIYYSLGASYRFHEKVSFGLSVNYVSSSIDTIRARNPDGSDDLILANGALKEGRSYLTAKGGSLSMGAGVVFMPTDSIRIGYSYQSQPGFGETRMQGELFAVLNNASPPEKGGVAEMIQSLPDIHRLGAQWRVNQKIELRMFADYVRWSVFERQCLLYEEGSTCSLNDDGGVDGDSPVTLNINRLWRDAFGIRAGASYWLDPSVELYLGGGYDGNAVPDETIDPSLFDMEKLSVAAGVKLSLLKERLKLAFTYTQVIYMTREVSVNADDPSSNAFKGVSNGPSSAGTYEQAIGVGNLNLEYLF